MGLEGLIRGVKDTGETKQAGGRALLQPSFITDINNANLVLGLHSKSLYLKKKKKLLPS